MNSNVNLETLFKVTPEDLGRAKIYLVQKALMEDSVSWQLCHKMNSSAVNDLNLLEGGYYYYFNYWKQET